MTNPTPNAIAELLALRKRLEDESDPTKEAIAKIRQNLEIAAKSHVSCVDADMLDQPSEVKESVRNQLKTMGFSVVSRYTKASELTWYRGYTTWKACWPDPTETR